MINLSHLCNEASIEAQNNEVWDFQVDEHVSVLGGGPSFTGTEVPVLRNLPNPALCPSSSTVHFCPLQYTEECK
jgi:hypothetical protein